MSGYKMLIGCLFSRVCRTLIFSCACLFPFLYSFLIRMLLLDLLPSKAHLNFKIWNFSNKFQQWFMLKTKACLSRLKLLNLNDLLIHCNTLNVWLWRNLIMQSRGDHFHEYINKWQFFDTRIYSILCLEKF